MNVQRLKPSGSVIAVAVALVIGLEAPAMAHQVADVAHRISGTTIEVHTLPGDRIKGNTVTGRQIAESTLATVPRARTIPALKWHDITAFKNGWSNLGGGRAAAAYAVDAQGSVHLRGAIQGTTSGTIAFTLPAAISSTRILAVPVVVDGSFGLLSIKDGDVLPEDGTGSPVGSAIFATSLAGVTFSTG